MIPAANVSRLGPGKRTPVHRRAKGPVWRHRPAKHRLALDDCTDVQHLPSVERQTSAIAGKRPNAGQRQDAKPASSLATVERDRGQRRRTSSSIAPAFDQAPESTPNVGLAGGNWN